MTHLRRLPFAAMAAAIMLALGAQTSLAQTSKSYRGQPKRPFSVADFAKVRWLEGRWKGTSPDADPMYEAIHFANDSTAEIIYYRDPAFSQQIGTGQLYLSVGRVFHTFGPNRWGATHVDTDGLYFVPQSNVRNSFVWTYQTPESWTATMHSGVSGQQRVTVYQMTRVK
jgi:hypothetical protein